MYAQRRQNYCVWGSFKPNNPPSSLSCCWKIVVLLMQKLWSAAISCGQQPSKKTWLSHWPYLLRLMLKIGPAIFITVLSGGSLGWGRNGYVIFPSSFKISSFLSADVVWIQLTSIRVPCIGFCLLNQWNYRMYMNENQLSGDWLRQSGCHHTTKLHHPPMSCSVTVWKLSR